MFQPELTFALIQMNGLSWSRAADEQPTRSNRSIFGSINVDVCFPFGNVLSGNNEGTEREVALKVAVLLLGL